MSMMRTFIAAVSLLTVACSGSPTGPTQSGSATLNVRITDSPFEDAKAVLVTFDAVSVHKADGEGWTTVPFADGTSRTSDLKKLEGAQDVLGVGALTPGHYTQIRLIVASAALYFTNGTPPLGPACAAVIAPPAGDHASLEISSGEVKLNRQFDLVAGDATTITLDFDGNRSIRETAPGRYRMRPVIGVVSVQ